MCRTDRSRSSYVNTCIGAEFLLPILVGSQSPRHIYSSVANFSGGRSLSRGCVATVTTKIFYSVGNSGPERDPLTSWES